jgi:hypothetical protein
MALPHVPEEDSPILPRSPYLNNIAHSAHASTSTFNAAQSPLSARPPPTPSLAHQIRKPSSLRNVRDRSSRDQVSASSASSIKRHPSPTPSATSAYTTKDTLKTGSKTNGTSTANGQQRIRNTPRLPHDHEAEPSPATLMYWSKAPVYGAIPSRSMRAHSVTLVDSVAWLFGGCDEKGCWKDLYCFDTGRFFRLSHLVNSLITLFQKRCSGRTPIRSGTFHHPAEHIPQRSSIARLFSSVAGKAQYTITASTSLTPSRAAGSAPPSRKMLPSPPRGARTPLSAIAEEYGYLVVVMVRRRLMMCGPLMLVSLWIRCGGS